MKNSDIYDLRSALGDLVNVEGRSFAYAIFKNIQLLDAEITIIDKIWSGIPVEYADFDRERALLCMNHSEKDQSGNPVVVQSGNGQLSYKISDIQRFESELVRLKDKYSDVISKKNRIETELKEFMDRESDLQLKMVNINDLPANVTASFLDRIKFIIE